MLVLREISGEQEGTIFLSRKLAHPVARYASGAGSFAGSFDWNRKSYDAKSEYYTWPPARPTRSTSSVDNARRTSSDFPAAKLYEQDLNVQFCKHPRNYTETLGNCRYYSRLILPPRDSNALLQVGPFGEIEQGNYSAPDTGVTRDRSILPHKFPRALGISVVHPARETS